MAGWSAGQNGCLGEPVPHDTTPRRSPGNSNAEPVALEPGDSQLPLNTLNMTDFLKHFFVNVFLYYFIIKILNDVN